MENWKFEIRIPCRGNGDRYPGFVLISRLLLKLEHESVDEENLAALSLTSSLRIRILQFEVNQRACWLSSLDRFPFKFPFSISLNCKSSQKLVPRFVSIDFWNSIWKAIHYINDRCKTFFDRTVEKLSNCREIGRARKRKGIITWN